MKRILFCQICPLFYEISVKKETIRRNISDLFSKEKIAKKSKGTEETLPVIVKSHTSIMLRQLEGVDMSLQENKITNLTLASSKINGIIIEPGETFSLWKTVGKTGKRQGYKEGLVIKAGGTLSSGTGGGLCQLANLIHYMVLNSPLQVTEIHHHSDALFPDSNRRVPFGTGTSVANNYVDYRFKNTSSQKIQLLVWPENDTLCGELRTTEQFPLRYKLSEENHHFRKEGEKFYRISQVYRTSINRETNEEVAKELILDNHSEVMYDYSLIPPNEIRC